MKRFMKAAALIGIAAFLAGCSAMASHLHNPADQALAEKAREQAKALAKGEQQVLDTMRSNVEKLKSSRDDIYDELRSGMISAHSTTVLGLTWEDFRKGVGGGKARTDSVTIKRMESLVENLLKEVKKDMPGAVQSVKDAKAALGELKKASKDAAEQIAQWRRRIAVLDKVVSIAPNLASGESVEGWEGYKKWLKDQANEFKNEDITFVAADGTEKKEKLLDAIQSIVKDSRTQPDPDAGKIIATIESLFPKDAPGLVLVLTELSKDLAELEVTRSTNGLRMLRQRTRAIQKADDDLDLAVKLMDDSFNLVPPAAFPDNAFVDDTIGKLVQQADNSTTAQDNLANAMEAIQNYVVAMGPLYAGVVSQLREDAHAKHLHSIRESSLAAAQHQALVARGIDGLVQYHSGGVKPEEVAEIIYRAAQLTILSVIASDVN